MNGPAEERLPRLNRLLYASGSIGGNAIGRSLDLWILFFYAPPDDADIARRGGTLATSLTLSAARLVEALDDPLIGYLSDRTRTGLGRCIPYVLVATPLFCAAFVLLWMPPDAAESTRNVVYLFVALWFFHLFSTLSGGPLESLLPEIAARRDDRVDIVTWQVALGVIGAVIGLVGAAVLKDAIGFQGMAVTIAVVALVSRFVALGGAWRPAMRTVRERSDDTREQIGSLIDAVRTCLRNDQFLVFLPSFILYNLGVLMITGSLPFLTRAVLEKGEEGSADITLPFMGFEVDPMISMLAVSIAVVVVLLPLMQLGANRRGKSWVYSRGMVAAIFTFPSLFFVGQIPGVPVMAQAFLFAVLVGLPLAPVQTFPNALIADITDYDHVLTGMRREATYYATQASLEKVAASLAPGLLAILITFGSTPGNTLGVRLVGPVAGVATLAGYLVFRRYWLPDEVTVETVRASHPRMP